MKFPFDISLFNLFKCCGRDSGQEVKKDRLSVDDFPNNHLLVPAPTAETAEEAYIVHIDKDQRLDAGKTLVMRGRTANDDGAPRDSSHLLVPAPTAETEEEADMVDIDKDQPGTSTWNRLDPGKSLFFSFHPVNDDGAPHDNGKTLILTW
mmetsp:Transcript_6153/g.11682  ORF Transcript_6153/g.11682 Transcript_6153/m.11682 type:complete len:150 (+) Transcript_6153:483-932(+)